MGKNLFSFEDYTNKRSTANESYSSFGDPTVRDVNVMELEDMLDYSYESAKKGDRVRPILILSREMKELGIEKVLDKTAQRLRVPVINLDLEYPSLDRIIRKLPSDNGSGGFIFIPDFITSSQSVIWKSESIMPAIMGLLQNGRFGNYELPEGWVILGSDMMSNIGKLDYAMRDRFKVVNLVRGAKIVDDRVISDLEF
jgi:hypothetical protein